MIGVFRQKRQGNVLLLFVFGILIKLPNLFIAHPAIVKINDGILYKKMVNWLNPVTAAFPHFFSIAAIFLIFLQAYLLTYFISNQRLMFKPNYLAGMAFILLTSFLPEFNQFSSQLLVSLLYLSIYINVFSIYGRPAGKTIIYNSGLLLGLATLLFFPSVLFLFWIYIALTILRPFRPNEWLLALLGILTPYYFLVTYFFLTGELSQVHFFEGLSIGFKISKPTLILAGAFFLMLLPLLTGIYYTQSLSGKMLIQVRKAWYLFLWYIAVCFVIVFFNSSTGYENWFAILVPVAAFHGFGYLNTELRIFPKISFWLAIVFIIGTQYFVSHG